MEERIPLHEPWKNTHEKWFCGGRSVHHGDFECDVIDLSVYAKTSERAEQTRRSRFGRPSVSTARPRLRPRLSVPPRVINDVRAKWEERKRTRLPGGPDNKGA